MKKKRQPSGRSDYGRQVVDDRGTQRRLAASRISKRRRRRNNWPLLLFGLVVLVAVFLMVRPFLAGGQPDPTHQPTVTTGPVTVPTTVPTAVPTSQPTAVATPLPTATPTPAMISAEQRSAALQAATEEVTALLDRYDRGRFGVYFMNLVGGETWGFAAEEPFVAASSIKIGLNTYLYTKIEAGEISLDDTWAYDNRPYPTGDYESGTGTIQNLPNGSRLSVRDTSGLSIRISDNCGTNMVIRHLGGIDAINPWLNSISGSVDYRQSISYTNYAGQRSSGRHRTCARDLGLHAVELFRLWQHNPTVYDPLIDDLSKTEFDFGIQKGIPESVQVAHKIGTNGIYATENDVGIVFSEEPFVLCVLTEMASAAEARRIQADIAAIFYSYVGLWPWS